MSRLAPEKPKPDPVAGPRSVPMAFEVIHAIEVFERLDIELPSEVLLKALDAANRLRVAEIEAKKKLDEDLLAAQAAMPRCLHCKSYIREDADEHLDRNGQGPYCSQRCVEAGS